MPAVRQPAVPLGPLAALLADPEVTDILVNGPAQVWVERAGRLERTSVTFPDDEAVRRLAVRLVAAGGRRLDAAMPFADLRLADGVRMHAVLAPTAVHGTCLSLRRPRPRPFSLDELTAVGTLDPAMTAALRAVLAARLAALVTGGTGTGKSTLLAALLDALRPAERVVLVEDTAELVVARENLVRLEARPPNIEGAGEITQRDLVRQALRMRPDRLVVGEVRGPEVLDLLVALNTGHEGGLSTVHANAIDTLPSRMEALGAMAGLERAALHSHLATAVQVAVHLRRDPDGRRRVSAIGVLRSCAGGEVRVVPALVAVPAEHGAGTRVVRAEGFRLLRALLDERGVMLAPPAPASRPLDGRPPLAGGSRAAAKRQKTREGPPGAGRRTEGASRADHSSGGQELADHPVLGHRAADQGAADREADGRPAAGADTLPLVIPAPGTGRRR